MNDDILMSGAVDFNPDGTVFDDWGQVVPGGVVVLHNNMIKALRSQYPAFKDYWHIVVDTRGGTVQLRNLALSGDFGITMYIVNIDPEMRLVRKKAGELLERFNVLRGRALSIKHKLPLIFKNIYLVPYALRHLVDSYERRAI